jgi:toxin ParE1/3/4
MSKSANGCTAFYSPDGNPLVLPAAEDLERICERIERDNPDAARRVAKTIYEACGRLKDFPNTGRASSRMSGRRELTFATLPYIVVYQVTENAVEISRYFTVRRTGLNGCDHAPRSQTARGTRVPRTLTLA